MLFQSPRLSLLHAASRVKIAGARRLRIAASGMGVEMSCEGEGCGARYRIALESTGLLVKRGGSCTIAAEMFARLLSRVKSPTVECHLQNYKLTVDPLESVPAALYDAMLSIPVESEDARPVFPAFGAGAARVHFGARELAGLIDRVAFAALNSRKADEPLTGVQVELGGKRLTLTCGDDFQVSMASVPHGETAPWRGIVPLCLLKPWISGSVHGDSRHGEAMATIVFEGDKVGFSAGSFEAWTKTIPGEFDSGWKPLLKEKRSRILRVNAEDFADRLEPLVDLTEPDESTVELSLEEDSLTIRVDDLGCGENQWDGVDYTGEPVVLQCDGRRLLAWLRSARVDEALEIGEGDEEGRMLVGRDRSGVWVMWSHRG